MNGRTESDLEKGVQMVLDAGLATGHADTWLQLLEEVLDQVEDLRLEVLEEREVGEYYASQVGS